MSAFYDTIDLAKLQQAAQELQYPHLHWNLPCKSTQDQKQFWPMQPEDPPIQTVMRDLGIDHQAGCRRRIATLQQRFKKNRQRRLRLRTLKLPNLKTRFRLHRGGIQQGQGLAPRLRQALRRTLANHLGLQSGGQPDVVYDQYSHKYMDPADQVVLQHIHALHTLLAHWPPDHLPRIEQTEANLLLVPRERDQWRQQ